MRSLSRRARRPNTLIAYRNELEDFGCWLLEERVGSLPELKRTHIEMWQDDLHDRKALSTRGVAATALRGLLKWAADQELELSSPTLWLRVATPRVPPPLPRPISLRDLTVIQAALADPDPRQLWRLRTRALFWLIYSSGARVSEALSLMRGSFDGDSAVILQKGGRKHTLVISKRARAAIEDYEAARIDQLPCLFASTEYSNAPLRKREVQESWDLLAAALDVSRFTTHQLRHSCATAILRETGDVLLAAKHLGHRSLQAIQGYAEVAMDKRRHVVALLDGALAG
jgi:integrase/recombinase XerD